MRTSYYTIVHVLPGSEVDDVQVPVDPDRGCHVGRAGHEGVGEGEEVGHGEGEGPIAEPRPLLRQGEQEEGADLKGSSRERMC